MRWGDELYELWGWGVGDELLEGKGFALYEARGVRGYEGEG